MVPRFSVTVTYKMARILELFTWWEEDPFGLIYMLKTIPHLVHINDKHPKCAIEIKYKTYPRSSLPNRSADSNGPPVAWKRGMNTSALAFKTEWCSLCLVMLKCKKKRHAKVTNTRSSFPSVYMYATFLVGGSQVQARFCPVCVPLFLENWAQLKRTHIMNGLWQTNICIYFLLKEP